MPLHSGRRFAAQTPLVAVRRTRVASSVVYLAIEEAAPNGAHSASTRGCRWSSTARPTGSLQSTLSHPRCMYALHTRPQLIVHPLHSTPLAPTPRAYRGRSSPPAALGSWCLQCADRQNPPSLSWLAAPHAKTVREKLFWCRITTFRYYTPTAVYGFLVIGLCNYSAVITA